MKMLHASEDAVYDWNNFYRDLKSKELVENPIIFGGPNDIIEIDESKWGGKRKCNRGRTGPEKPRIFDMYCRRTKKVGLVIVPQRDEATLVPILRQHVHPQSKIYHDDWGVYRNFHNYGFEHFVVNHSENFLNPMNGVHTQNIESFWQKANYALKKMFGQCQVYFDEVIYRWNHTHENMFENVLALVSKFYNPNVHIANIQNAPEIQY